MIESETQQSTTESSSSLSLNNDGRLTRPNGLPFRVGFSKEHPSEQKAFTGLEDDLLIPFCKSLSCVCYHDLFVAARDHGIVIPCPNAPRFENCNVLFDAMHDFSHVNNGLYRKFVSWWTDAIARSILTAAVEDGIHFNLAGYTKERIKVVTERYNRMMKVDDCVEYLNYDFIKILNGNDDEKQYRHVPHLIFNSKWSEEEKKLMENCTGLADIYPGFTDWDLGFILRDERLLGKCIFYCVNTVEELKNLKPMTSDELKDKFGIVKSK
ncbi:hypothetical protein C9374_012741 [Naegleria lovaniensis]|uniref:Uncharacterized protein n=1 Tax=Naegleria lovaniensis TaxID=51637 RepID=A0AA88GXQ9_NAELO|nr:uncharacterized protein C9374_012741 [Naegleria lovaniensis]KAG2392489.1 hypothetical protein C9374_012741 [Naegleria lovaniensis]